MTIKPSSKREPTFADERANERLTAAADELRLVMSQCVADRVKCKVALDTLAAAVNIARDGIGG